MSPSRSLCFLAVSLAACASSDTRTPEQPPVSTAHGLGRLARASKRGVKVRVVLAGISDVVISKHAERYLYRWMQSCTCPDCP